MINCIIRLLNRAGLTVALAAPTGRAAKRMTGVTGQEARTIHRFAEYAAGRRRWSSPLFGKTEEDPLKSRRSDRGRERPWSTAADAFAAQGDSCGHAAHHGGRRGSAAVSRRGQRCAISSKAASFVARLTEVFRQAAQSHIVSRSPGLNSGEMPIIQNRDTDFFFEKRESLPARTASARW